MVASTAFRTSPHTASAVPAGVRAGARRLPHKHFWPDHLGWFLLAGERGGWCRLSAGDTLGPVILTSRDLDVPGARAESALGVLLELPPAVAPLVPSDLYLRLARLSPLVRVGSPTVWEAAATAVIRQVVHCDQARIAFGRVCEMFGPSVLIGGRARHAFPTPGAVVSIGTDRLRTAGIGFKARTLHALAEWCLDVNEHLEATDLHEALLGVRGVGPWTASVAVCDVHSDFSFYPIDDLAVRARAQTQWPQQGWPSSPPEFARRWREQTAPHTAALTAFMLADAVLSGK
jgi:DNA-3-methyladenine glycosylase II